MRLIAIVAFGVILFGFQPLRAQPTQSTPPPTAAARIAPAPETSPDRSLALATWALAGLTAVLAIANAALCIITWRGARKQSQDMRESIGVSERAAEAASRSADAASRSSDAANQSAQLGARQRRESLERETNVAVHRVRERGAYMHLLADNLVSAYTTLYALSGRNVGGDALKPVKDRCAERQRRAKEMVESAGVVLARKLSEKTDEELTAILHSLDGSLVQIEAAEKQLSAELASIEDQARQRREQESRYRASIGERPR